MKRPLTRTDRHEGTPGPGTGRLSRRRLLAGTTALTLAGLAGVRPSAVLGAAKPIRVASLNDYSKVFRELSIDQERGFQLALDQVGGQVAGRPIEMVRADEESNPSLGVQKAREMIQREQVDFIMGPISSAVAAAIRDLVAQSPVTWICPTAGNIELTGARCAKNIFRPTYDTYQVSYPFGKWVAAHITKRIVTTYPDFAFGQQINRFFLEGYRAAGGTVLAEVPAPLGTTDFSSYFSRIQAAKPEAVFACQVGADAVNFVKDFAQFGLKRTIKLLTLGFTVMNTLLPAEGNAAQGIVNVSFWARSVDRPRNRQFMSDFKKKFGVFPSLYNLHGYDAGVALIAALNATGGDSSVPKMVDALERVTIDSPRGQLRFNPATHQVITPMFVLRVEGEGSGMDHVIIDKLGTVLSPTFGCDLTK